MISFRKADLIEHLTPMKLVEFYFSSWAGAESKMQSSYRPNPEVFTEKDDAKVDALVAELFAIPGSYAAQGKKIIHVDIENIGKVVENLARKIPGFKGAATMQDTKFEYRVKVWFK